MTAVTHKRPASTGSCCPTVAGKKRELELYDLGSIYNYETLEMLGEGTYGTVLKAQDRRTGETVAVKRIRPDEKGVTDLDAVLHEAACLEACRGAPSIVQMKGVVADEACGDVLIVTEFVGPSLESLLPPCRRSFSDAEVRAVMRQLLRGAETIHGAGMIHRDIKPDNVLVGPGGALKICDLGMAVRIRPAGQPYPVETVAALPYRAPELIWGSRSRRTYGTAVDMWALGCVMIELLIGEPLFKDAETGEDVLCRARDLQYQMQSMTESEFLPKLSKAGHEVLRGLLSLVPEKRLTAADALKHRWFDEEDAPLYSVLCSDDADQDQRGFTGVRSKGSSIKPL